MKQRLFIAMISILSWGLLQAQPVLSGSTTMPLGEQVGIIRVAATSVDNQGAAGSNITWDFSDMQAIGSQTASFLAPDATPFAGNFGNANVAVSYQSGLQMGSAVVSYEFFSSLASGLIRNGLATAQNVQVSYSDPQNTLTFPFTYGTTQTDNFAATFATAGQSVEESGTISVTGDAYGNLLLPNASINGVLRVRILQEYTDVVSGAELEFSVETYAWFHPELAYPLLTISTENVVGSPTTVRNVHYAQFVPSTSIGDIYPNFSFVSAPNPATDQSNIRFYMPQNAPIQIAVYNAIGQKVTQLLDETLNIGNHELPLSVANYPNGIYFVQLSLNGLTETRLLVVAH